jgi:hypothetical protein
LDGKHGRYISLASCMKAHFHIFGVGFCGGFPLALNCASLPDGQDIFARAIRSIATQ